MRARTMMFLGMLAATGLGCGTPTDSNAVCLDENGIPLPIAPHTARVDLARPTFSNPTSITNPLNPISALSRVVLLGSEGGLPLRVETTLLPYTRIIDLDGRPLEALVSQYVAWIDGRLAEVAIDWYAQADDGAVWYLGEDVFNYANGVVAETEGTWLAGDEAPAAMIMPANPQVGDVWRPENVCGVVFEEVTAQSVGITVNGPRGPVTGAIVVEELHMDATTENKTFAPGYGEFSTGTVGGDLEAVAVAVPTDALVGPVPAELTSVSTRADSVFYAAQVGDWSSASAMLGTMASAWSTLQAGGVPPFLDVQMDGALGALTTAVNVQNTGATRQAAVRVGLASLDLLLRYRPRNEIDVALLDVWARQLLVDVAAGNQPAMLGDAASLKWIRERLGQDVLEEPDLRLVDADLDRLTSAVAARNLGATQAATVTFRDHLRGVKR